VKDARVDVVSLSQYLWSTGDQLLNIVDDTADIVRNASSRIG